MPMPTLPLILYVDADCPLCAREIHLLQRRADPQRLRLVDISAADFDASAAGLSRTQLGQVLHARSADGQWLTGIDATYWSWYSAGLGNWVTPLTWRPLRPFWLLAYRLFALLRPHLDWLPHPDGAARCRSNCGLNKPDHEQPKQQ